MAPSQVNDRGASDSDPAPPSLPGSCDFSFAFAKPQFSNCTLRVHLISPSQCSGVKTSAAEHTREVPVSTPILAANSAYFMRMLTGAFREAAHGSHLDVSMLPDEEASFMDLLQSLYAGGLPPHVSGDLQSTLRVLLLADRFEAQRVLSSCAAALPCHTSKLTIEGAMSLLDLPESLQHSLPELGPALVASKQCINAAYAPLLRQLQPGASLLDLPEADFQKLLEADYLEVESEDEVARVALAWLRYRFPGPSEYLHALSRVVLPRLRLVSLSPEVLQTFCSYSADLLAPGDDLNQSSSPCSPLALPPFEGNKEASLDSLARAMVRVGKASEVAQQYGDSDSACAVKALATALVSASETRVVDDGAVLPGQRFVSSLDKCSVPLAHPRASCRSPDRKVHVDIPLNRCAEWRLPRIAPLLSTAPVHVCGRWFAVHLSLSRPHPRTCLGMHLSCDKDMSFPKGRITGFTLAYRFCVKTSLSQPAYQQLHAGRVQITDAAIRARETWGCDDALGKPWDSVIQEEPFFFPEGVLQVRADIWVN